MKCERLWILDCCKRIEWSTLAWWTFVGCRSALFQEYQEFGWWWNQVQRDGGVAYLIPTHESEPCCKRCADGLLKPRAVCWSTTGHHSDNVFEAERDPTLGVSRLMFQTSVKGARKASSFFARVSLLSVSRDPGLGSTLTHSKLLWVCWRVAHSVLTQT